IDQHAAHERIGFERLCAQYRAAGIAKQTLLLPVIVDLGPAQVAAITEHQAILAATGIDAEPFGGGSVAVTALPALLTGGDVPTLVTALASELAEYGRTTAMDAATLHLLATMACHRQVRAGDPLSEEELTALVGQMTGDISADRCPHGRPTWIRIPKQEIEKWFHRR
ncbi:MAG: DNA mismatch repair protein MutL, partial [Deltaproteobacteria bacterium]|nr:DNA mismatch repair protein MutL [Deltaproteobacteria bacterium]